MTDNDHQPDRKPAWMKVPLPKGKKYIELRRIVNDHKLATICQSGNCPNMAECWSHGTATFMILGTLCTRTCTFCDVKPGKPLPPDPHEPMRIAEAVRLMQLKHCVITSVTRDDLPDKGAAHWANTIAEVKKVNPAVTMEVLIPDMRDDLEALQLIVDARPEIVSHNMETISRLYPQVRPQANYDRSLRQIRQTALMGVVSKSGFMLGLGETDEEVYELINDLHKHDTEIITIGQYLPPSNEHFPLKEYVKPEKFELFKNYGLHQGIRQVVSAPLVRSSYSFADSSDNSVKD